MMGTRQKLKYFDEIETVCRDKYHSHPFHKIKKRLSRRRRKAAKKELRIWYAD